MNWNNKTFSSNDLRIVSCVNCGENDWFGIRYKSFDNFDLCEKCCSESNIKKYKKLFTIKEVIE
jgi:hypothetical protein